MISKLIENTNRSLWDSKDARLCNATPPGEAKDSSEKQLVIINGYHYRESLPPKRVHTAHNRNNNAEEETAWTCQGKETFTWRIDFQFICLDHVKPKKKKVQ